MSQLRSLAHLEEQLGPARFRALLDPANIGRVKALGDMLVLESSTLVIGDRTYDILSPVHESEDSVSGETFVRRTAAMGASLGEEDAIFIGRHQAEIPEVQRGQMQFVFTDYCNPRDQRLASLLLWQPVTAQTPAEWVYHWVSVEAPNFKWTRYSRVLRRRPAEKP